MRDITTERFAVSFAMIQNFIRVALRNFLRQRLYSIINVVGLTTGLICTLFIFLWVRDEVSKDKFHDDAQSIFRIVSNLDLGDGRMATWTITPGPLADEIHESVPGIRGLARTMSHGAELMQVEDKNFMEEGIYADPDFFKIFSFPILHGEINPEKGSKNWVAISKSLALKLFGVEDAVGKVIKVASAYEVPVNAVFDDIGTESSLHFDYVMPFEVERDRRGTYFTWGNFDYSLYAKLLSPDQASSVISEVNKKAAKHPESKDVSYYIQPFTDSYLHANFENGIPAGGRIGYVRLFTTVAIFILLIACINFMNMATAKAATRMKEVGVRKVVGAQRMSLIVQFISESLLITFFSMILAVGIVLLALPMFNTLVAKHIELHLADPILLTALIVIGLITALSAGCYPAFVLSSYKPVNVLKGTLSASFSGSRLRKSLVIFQFTLTVVMVASAIVVYRQIQFIRNKDVGYNREAMLSFPMQGTIAQNFESFRNELSEQPGVKKVSRSSQSLVQVNNQNGSVKWPGKPEDDATLFRTVVVDFDFLEAMELKLKQGRFFSREFADSANFVLSQRAVDAMGLKEPLGQKISQWGTDGVVVGVVEDFHSRSMHESIDPIVFLCRPGWTYKVYVKVDGAKAKEVVAEIEKIYKKYAPEYPLEYAFMDDDFERLYNNERITSTLAFAFTTMAIIISGLGLLGLASYTTERKRKEISIRKTLGASVSSLITGMSKDFIRLSFIAALIGCPAAYYLMTLFLEGYAYHTVIGWEVFVVTACLVFVVSLTTVIFQVTKAAVANPVDALRNE